MYYLASPHFSVTLGCFVWPLDLIWSDIFPLSACCKECSPCGCCKHVCTGDWVTSGSTGGSMPRPRTPTCCCKLAKMSSVLWFLWVTWLGMKQLSSPLYWQCSMPFVCGLVWTHLQCVMSEWRVGGKCNGCFVWSQCLAKIDMSQEHFFVWVLVL